MKVSNIFLVISILVLAVGAGTFFYRLNLYNNVVNSWGQDPTTNSLWLQPGNPNIQAIKQVELFRGYIIAARNNFDKPEEIILGLSNIKFSNIDTDVNLILPTKIRKGEAYDVIANAVTGQLEPQTITTSIAGDLFQAKQIDIELQYALGHSSYEEVNKLYLYFSE